MELLLNPTPLHLKEFWPASFHLSILVFWLCTRVQYFLIISHVIKWFSHVIIWLVWSCLLHYTARHCLYPYWGIKGNKGNSQGKFHGRARPDSFWVFEAHIMEHSNQCVQIYFFFFFYKRLFMRKVTDWPVNVLLCLHIVLTWEPDFWKIHILQGSGLE